jgi:hypothetical protein
LLLLIVGGGQPLWARDVFVILSGGVSPFENNYSQYLQARALVNYFEENYPPESTWVFFGAGNVEGQKAVLGDVRREVKRGDTMLDTWLAGSLPRNLPARREVVLKTLKQEILPAVTNGGTIYLFVGDHGSQTSGKDSESVINLWNLEPDPVSEHGWRITGDEALGVAELRRVLAKGIGKGRIVFCMTQCHAGGFHYLAIPHEMVPNPKWFATPPERSGAQPQTAFPAVAGFTATDQYSPAAGCNPDPDPDNWAGYERYIPEHLLGMDLLTSERTGRALPSFAEAHVAATLVDRTIDKPYSTSEQYLERWATLIDKLQSTGPKLTRAARTAIAAYNHTVDAAAPKVSDPAFRERQALFRSFTEKMAGQDPDTKELLLAGKRRELERVIGESGTREPRRPDDLRPPNNQQTRRQRRGGGPSEETRRLWNEKVRPAWKAAIEAGEVTNLPAGVVEFEKYLLVHEDRGINYFFAGGARSLQEAAFWNSGYSNPETVDPDKAEAVVRWGTQRRAAILAWAKSSDDKEVRNAAEKLPPPRGRRFGNNPFPSNDLKASEHAIDPQTAAARTLFYRRVLGAWEFLLAMNERPALARVRELTELERTPLPPPNPITER